MKDILPSWHEIDKKLRAGGKLDPIDSFIHEFEPVSSAGDEFRKMLIEALYFWSGKPNSEVE